MFGVHVEDLEEEFLGEEGGFDLDSALIVGKVGGGGAGGDTLWSVFVGDDENRDVVRQCVDVDDLEIC